MGSDLTKAVVEAQHMGNSVEVAVAKMPDQIKKLPKGRNIH